jgi:hypothetical protein
MISNFQFYNSILTILVIFTLFYLKKKHQSISKNTLILSIEAERKRQESYYLSIFITLQNLNSGKIQNDLNNFPLTDRLQMLQLIKYKFSNINNQIIVKGTMLSSIYQRKFICSSYYFRGTCLTKSFLIKRSECMFPHIKNEKIAREFYCPSMASDDYNKCQHLDSCIFKHDIIVENEDTQCSICQIDILSTSKRFSLFQNCEHIHCVDCAKKWHKKKKIFSCSICRKTSKIALSSNVLLTGIMKSRKMSEYFEKLHTKNCKYGTRCKTKYCAYQHPELN